MEAQEKTKRFKPQDWVIGLGIAVAVFTALSGVAAAIFDQKEIAQFTEKCLATSLPQRR